MPHLINKEAVRHAEPGSYALRDNKHFFGKVGEKQDVRINILFIF